MDYKLNLNTFLERKKTQDGYISDYDIFGDDEVVEYQAKLKKTYSDIATEWFKLRWISRIPPPPLSMSVSSMLSSYLENTHLHLEVAKSDEQNNTEIKKKIDARFGIYYNTNNEDLELLRQQVAEKNLVLYETSSSFIPHEPLTNSAKKRKRRNGWAKSPGSRLSYLAKRRTTFSQRTGLENARVIELDSGGPSKGSGPKPVSLKRALFQSPDKMENSTPDYGRVKRLKLTSSYPRNFGNTLRLLEVPPKKPSVTRNLKNDFESLSNCKNI